MKTALTIIGALVVVFLLLALLEYLMRPSAADERPDPEPAEHVIPLDRWEPIQPSTSATSTTSTTHHAAAVIHAPRAAPIGELQEVIRRGFARFGPEVAEQAVHVAGCESTGDETGQNIDPTARNGDHWGAFQIAWSYHKNRVAHLGYTQAQLLEIGPNVDVAADIFAEEGWGPWTCRTAA